MHHGLSTAKGLAEALFFLNLQIEYNFADKLDGVFEIYDFTGRMVYSKKLSETIGKEQISVKYLSRGVYMYRLVSGGISIDSGKVVIIK
jgi:hypothetical protein